MLLRAGEFILFFVCPLWFLNDLLFYLDFRWSVYFISPFLFTFSQPNNYEPLLFLINKRILRSLFRTLKQYSPAVVTGHIASYVIYGGKTRRHPLEILLSFFSLRLLQSSLLSPFRDFNMLLILSNNACLFVLHCCLSTVSLNLLSLEAMIASLINSKLRLELFLESRPTFPDSLSFNSAGLLEVLNCFNVLLIESKNYFLSSEHEKRFSPLSSYSSLSLTFFLVSKRASLIMPIKKFMERLG